MSLDKNKTAVIFLGAASFPKAKSLGANVAFSNAKDKIHSYFVEIIGVGQLNILDLFDSDDVADLQDTRIGDFIREAVKNGITDLFIYYVGHGGFTSTNNHFYIALKNTRPENPALSSLTIQALGATVTQTASSLRTFVVLDCCFSGAAGTQLMADGDYGAALQVKDFFPTKGIAILSASSAGSPALVISERNITMFTEGLEAALRQGDPGNKNKYLSLREIKDLTFLVIKNNNPVNAIRPEVMTPFQVEGDIADLQHFENFGLNDTSFTAESKVKEIHEEMSLNNFARLAILILDFTHNFDPDDSFLAESIMICSECNELAQERKDLPREQYVERKKNIFQDIIQVIKKILNAETNEQ